MAKREPREKVDVRLPWSLAKWLRREAAQRHSTVSAVVEECVRRAKDTQTAELFARAALKGICLALARGDRERAREFARELVGEAWNEMKGAGGGERRLE